MSTLNCPQCGQLDKVQKVSALYAQGTSRTSYESPSAAVQINDTTFYGTQERTAISRTALSERLTPPTPPSIRKPMEATNSSGCGIIAIIGVLLGIVMVFCGFQVKFDGWQLIFAGAILIIAVPIYYFSDASKIKSGKAKQEYKAKLEVYNRTMAPYESAQRQWDSAYYCGRCDGIFSLGSGKITPINEFYKFLNKYGA